VELSDLYSSSKIIPVTKARSIREAEHEPGVGGNSAYGVLLAKLEGITPTERPNRKWEGNIKFM